MLDFTSALYLGIHHPSRSLKPWRQLTRGVPAALAEPPGASEVARDLAELQGCEQAVLMSSTLHLFMDLFGMLGRQPVTLYLDEGAYAIASWGAERAAARGVAVHRFGHHEPDALLAQITGQAHSGKRPVVVADGFCPICGEPAPIRDYLEIVRRCGGLLVLDDTQALGILGEKPRIEAPYGAGGGGMLCWSGVSGPDILVGASLAKGFGAPMAALAGSELMLRRFTTSSDTRVHCSPPSVAVIHAAEHALAVNQEHGNLLRQCLAQRVRQFRDGLGWIGWSATGGLFPVQTLRAIAGNDAVRMHQRLSRWGIGAVLSRPRSGGDPRLSFLITARHSSTEIDRCLDALDGLANGAKTSRRLQIAWRRLSANRLPPKAAQPLRR